MAGEGAAGVGGFVGRAHELRQIEDAWAAAAEGRGSVVLVSGEAGIGKSRLCAEAVARAETAGMTVVSVRCWADSGGPALWPCQPIVPALGGDEAVELLEVTAARAADPQVSAGSAGSAGFAALVDRLAAATGRAPVCALIDDVHVADAGTLQLLRFVVRALPRLRLALVLSRRPDRPDPDRFEAGLLADIAVEAKPLVLRGLDVADSGALLAAHGFTGLEPDLLASIQRITRGNPLHLRHIVTFGSPGCERTLPDGIRATVERSLDGLAPDVRSVLRTTSVLGPSPSVAEAAAVAGVDPATVLDAVGAAAAVGLIGTAAGTDAAVGGVDRFAFGHELVRAAVEAGLPSSDRLAAHASAVRLLAADGPELSPDRRARRAHHALVAAPLSVDDARVAVAACEDAARSMLAGFAYEQADTLLTAAVDLHDRPGVGPAPGRLLTAWAQAAVSCGRLGEACRRFDRAAGAAAHEDDPVLFAEAALGLGGHWLNNHRGPVERARVLGLQRAALERLPIHEAALRARLEVRLAAEAAYGAGLPEPELEPVFRALASARRTGDTGAVAEALHLTHHVLLVPGRADAWLPLAEEQIRVASEAGHGLLALMGLCWRAIDLFLLGDQQALRALEDLRERAEALACRNVVYMVAVMDVMLLVRAGRLDEAEAAAQRCHEMGVAAGEVDAIGYFGAHTLAIRWIQGRETELLEAAEALASSPTLVPAEFGFRATVAAIAARAGQHDRAIAGLDHLTARGLGALPRSSDWLVGVAAIIEAAAELGDATRARAAYDLLLPFADLPLMPSLAVVCLGSAERVLGTAALAFGDVDGAIAHLERAVEASRRLGNRPLVAISRAELASALLRRGRPGDRATAIPLLDQALAEADAMALTGRIAAWRAARAAADEPSPAPGSLASPLASGPPGVRTTAGSERQGSFRRVGSGWLVAIDDHQAYVADRVGIGYLVVLLRHPGQGIAALALAGAGLEVGSDGRSRYELIDDTARAAYAERIGDLIEDLAEAEAKADIGRTARVQGELDILVHHMGSATGLHGRPRAFRDEAERARTSVRKAVKRAIDEIDAAAPVVGQVLRSSITTGTVCTYAPGPDARVAWSFDAPSSGAGARLAGRSSR